jgi:REP element-mobilizing transposase RayT
MARLARIVAPGCPHHVTARGNRREPIFFEDGDQDIYRDLLAEQMDKASVEVWAYCLMPNHVHLILRPLDQGGLAQALGAAHRRWANFVNARGRWRGHLVERDGAPARARRQPGSGRAGPGAGGAVCRTDRDGAGRSGLRGDPGGGDHRPAFGDDRVHRGPGTATGPADRAPRAGAQAGHEARGAGFVALKRRVEGGVWCSCPLSPAFPAERIQVRGYGDANPVSDNSTDSGRQKNRRVEVILGS